MFTAFQFAFVVTAPIFLIICVGAYLRKIDIIGDGFVKGGSSVVFRLALPCLLFTKVSVTDYTHLPISFAIYSVLSLLICFLFADRFLTRFFKEYERGVIVQGTLRSNIGIIGLAYCLNAFGDSATAPIAVYIACNIVLINILSVITLNRHHGAGKGDVSAFGIFKSVVTNPLIIAVAVALLFSIFNIKLPSFLSDTLGYLARLTLPLALLCVGAAIRWQEFRSSKSLYVATAGKLIIFPIVVTGGAIMMGFRGVDLGVIYLMSASPSATVGYSMVRAVGGNAHLAAAIIGATSLASIVTTTVGLFLLKTLSFL